MDKNVQAIWCYQNCVVPYSHACVHTERRSDTPYALHICVRNRPEIERDPFLAVHVKSNQLWTQAGKKVSLTGIFTNIIIYFILFFLVGHTAFREKLQFHCICRYENALCMNADVPVIKTVGTEMQTSF